MISTTREQAIQDLAENEMNSADPADLVEVLINGCDGWESYTNEQLEIAMQDELGIDCKIACPDPVAAKQQRIYPKILQHDETTTFVFDTEAEINAFMLGIEYVNDSAVEIIDSGAVNTQRVIHVDGVPDVSGFFVTLFDRDGE